MTTQKLKKRHKGKLDRYFTQFDILHENDHVEEEYPILDHRNAPIPAKDSVDPQTKRSYNRLIRQLFPPEEEYFQPLPQPTEIPTREYTYIQMRLDVERITQQYLKDMDWCTMREMLIRVATLNDIPSLVRIYNNSFKTGCDPWMPTTEQQFKQIFNFHHTMILVAKFKGTDIGFIIIDFEGKENETGIIAALAVDPVFRRQGVGHYLGLAAWDYLRRNKVKELLTEVFEKNIPSYRLISGLGFEPYGKKVYNF